MERQILSAYGAKTKCALMFKGKGRTKSQFMDDCNINRIVQRAEKNGVLDHVQNTPPTYGDASSIDFQQAMNTIITANGLFADLPSNIRRRFGNDPKEYLEFIEDPENIKEAISLDLLTGPKEPEAVSQPLKTSEDTSEGTKSEVSSDEQA